MKEYEIGPNVPSVSALRGKYVGAREDLKGDTGYISPKGDGWIVQVDRIASGLGYGWWDFPKEDWTPDGDV